MKKKTIDQVIETLKNDFIQWEYAYNNGTNDPLWADGVNLNLIRNHIIYDKKQIEKLMISKEYPEIYYKDTPIELDVEYMANSNEIRKLAKQILKEWKSYFYLEELKCASSYLDKYQLVETGIQASLNRIRLLETAINDDDLVTMRRLGNYGDEQVNDLKNAFEALCKLNQEEEHQIFFAEILEEMR